ncbi:MAG: Flp pilus assembly protein CpaB [Gammaproteobacteria bacterium]|jgi:pilus assembly protein CpaB|nr:Flp pilus assembly protein CpaB [Zhongshania sp.]MBU1833455.1 Flp pilus assembly protein CpaB [Gammaproteobacteria bacterium]
MSIAKYRYPIALILALACAVTAFFLTKHYFDVREKGLREKIRSEAKLVDVVVAKMTLPIGARVDLDTMMIKSVPSEYVPDGVIFPSSYPDVERKYLSAPMSEGKPLLRYMVEGVSKIDKFSDLLAFGERAVTLEVDGVSSIAHMLEAGDYIDLGVIKNKGADFNLILERARVLSTGNFSVADPKLPGMYKSAQYSTVTLGVAGEYVKAIYEAQLKYQLVFLLRNDKDIHSASYDASAGKPRAVTVYGGTSTDGVIRSYQDFAQLTSTLETISPVIRNSKGRMVRVLSNDRLVNESRIDSGNVKAEMHE